MSSSRNRALDCLGPLHSFGRALALYSVCSAAMVHVASRVVASAAVLLVLSGSPTTDAGAGAGDGDGDGAGAAGAGAESGAAAGLPVYTQYRQREYVLSGYLDPPLNNASYQALQDANFTGVFGDRTCVYAGGSSGMCSANGRRQAELCAQYGLAACFPGFSSAGAVPLGGSVAGYYLRDEPHANEFGGLAKTAAGIRKLRPGALVFINLLGGYMASEAAAVAWWGFKTYEEYVVPSLVRRRPRHARMYTSAPRRRRRAQPAALMCSSARLPRPTPHPRAARRQSICARGAQGTWTLSSPRSSRTSCASTCTPSLATAAGLSRAATSTSKSTHLAAAKVLLQKTRASRACGVAVPVRTRGSSVEFVCRRVDKSRTHARTIGSSFSLMLPAPAGRRGARGEGTVKWRLESGEEAARSTPSEEGTQRRRLNGPCSSCCWFAVLLRALA